MSKSLASYSGRALGLHGLGLRQDRSELHRSGSPILLIATGVMIALLWVAVLIGLARIAVRLDT
jgi:hypothetical protein